jgi:membrane protease YdiL (CAAX protease family)
MKNERISERGLVAPYNSRILIDLAAIYLLPVVLLTTGIVPFRLRFYALALMTVVAMVLSTTRQYSMERLGLTRPAWIKLVSFSVLPPLAVLALMYPLGLLGRLTQVPTAGFYLFFMVISAPAQEFLYRSFLFVALSSNGVTWRPAMILISAFLFAGMHIIYRDALTVALTFLVGLIWALFFSRTRNFFMVAASHACLGVIAIGLGAV